MDNGTEGFSAFVGIDWGDSTHAVCVRDATGVTALQTEIPHTPEFLEEWVASLRNQFSTGKIAVCLEQAKGPLIYHLMCYDFFTLYPINPKALKTFRESFTISGAKFDGGDAELMCEMLEHHAHRLHPWEPEDSQTRLLMLLCRDRRKTVDERTALTNCLTITLKTYFPQAIPLVNTKLHSPIACAFLEKWESLESLQRSRPKTVEQFLRKHRCTDEEEILKRLELIARAVPITTDEAVIQAAIFTVRKIIQQLRILNATIDEYEARIEEVFADHPDSDIFTSFPGAGEALAPRLLATWGTDRNRFPDALSMQCLSGVAPVTIKSGKKGENAPLIQRRFRCCKFRLQTFHEYARCSCRQSVWAKAYYDMLRDRGKDHHAAVRSLAYKWIRIMQRCWQTRTPYDEVRYIQALQKSGSPLLKYIP